MVAEGVETAPAVLALAERTGAETDLSNSRGVSRRRAVRRRGGTDAHAPRAQSRARRPGRLTASVQISARASFGRHGVGAEQVTSRHAYRSGAARGRITVDWVVHEGDCAWRRGVRAGTPRPVRRDLRPWAARGGRRSCRAWCSSTPPVPRSSTRTLAFSLLRWGPLGRVALTRDALPVILPVAFGLLDGDPIIRAGAGAVWNAGRRGSVLCFEVDNAAPDWSGGWSVVVIGRAELTTAADDQAAPAGWACRTGASTPTGPTASCASAGSCSQDGVSAGPPRRLRGRR